MFKNNELTKNKAQEAFAHFTLSSFLRQTGDFFVLSITQVRLSLFNHFAKTCASLGVQHTGY